MARRSPWWVGQEWSVKTKAQRSASDGRYQAGDWIEIYNARSKKEAQRLAKEWSDEMKSPTMVEPGPGHRSRRGA
jgi:hypothetical protein